MAKNAVAYNRGAMDIAEQRATFVGFMGMTKWGSLAVAVLVLFLAMVFCAHAGLPQSFGAAVVLTAVGILALREKKSAPAH
jgi:hypothetical protein